MGNLKVVNSLVFSLNYVLPGIMSLQLIIFYNPPVSPALC